MRKKQIYQLQISLKNLPQVILNGDSNDSMDVIGFAMQCGETDIAVKLFEEWLIMACRLRHDAMLRTCSLHHPEVVRPSHWIIPATGKQTRQNRPKIDC